MATLIYQELIGQAIHHCRIRIYNNLQPLLIVSWIISLIRSSKYPTRGQNILDLMFTSNPNLLSNQLHVPSPSHDHDALVLFELNFKPRLFNRNDHFTYLYKKAHISGLDNELNQLVQYFSTRDPTNFSVDENWLFFSSKLKAAIDKWVPKKQVKSHRRLPWIIRQIKRMMRKLERLFKLARSAKRASHWQSYKKYRNFVKRQIHLAHGNYVNEVIGVSLEVGDGKAFWNYIQLQRTESIGIPPLQGSFSNFKRQNN